jgi:transcription elongation factor Elf1
MALIECPDCGRKISDRAATCPDCACPVSTVVAEMRADEQAKAVAKTRKTLEREVDCPKCEARGWHKDVVNAELVQFCIPCEATGRVALCQAEDGFYAVAHYAVARFVSGELIVGKSGVVFFIGAAAPEKHRFPKPSARIPVEPGDIPW